MHHAKLSRFQDEAALRMADDGSQTKLLNMAALLRRCLAELDRARIGQVAACHIDLAVNLLEVEAQQLPSSGG